VNPTRLLLLASLLAAATGAYSPQTSFTGNPLHRTDGANVKFLVNQAIAAGIVNAEGATMITASSDPMAALQAAASTWSNVQSSTVQFAPLEASSAVNDPTDNKNTIVFLDTPENRSVTGSALAVTNLIFFMDGRIIETDIIFNPTVTFSSDLAPKTYDLQTVAAHEMGHALGANHSALLAATMFQATATQSTVQARLSADDRAFVSDLYPAPAAADLYGTISGKISLTTGEPVQGALLVATDPATGISVAGFAGAADGTYSFKVPRGSYLLYAEPADGPVFAANLYLPDDKVNASFQTGFFGGTTSPQLVDVTPGQASANIAVAAGHAPFDIQFLGTGRVAGSGDASVSSGVLMLNAGEAVDLILSGPGLDSAVTQDEVRLLGPGFTIRPDSIRLDPRITINGSRPLRLTVDVAPRTDPAVATIVVVKNSVAVAASGSLLVTPR
jgi:hypothetical protein